MGLDFNTQFQLHLESLRPPYVPSTGAPRAYASEAGQCDRRLYYRLSDTFTGGSDLEPPSATSSIALHIGNNLHDEFQAMMAVFYPDFSGEVKWIYPNREHPLISGRCDGIYTNEQGKKIALEIKTCSRYAYNNAKKYGTPSVPHALQAALSSLMLKTDLVQIVYIAKEFMAEYDPITVWQYPVAESLGTEEIRRISRIHKLASSAGTVPDRTARGEPILDPESHSECRYCPYVDRCILQGPEVPISTRKRRKSAAKP